MHIVEPLADGRVIMGLRIEFRDHGRIRAARLGNGVMKNRPMPESGMAQYLSFSLSVSTFIPIMPSTLLLLLEPRTGDAEYSRQCLTWPKEEALPEVKTQ